MSKHLFINYRRADEPGYAGRIADELIKAFKVTVFRDVDSLKSGEIWRERLDATLLKCELVIAVIGKHWDLELTSREEDKDQVRWELNRARELEIPIIPVVIANTALPDRDRLGNLAWLHDVQLFRLLDSDNRWPTEINRLLHDVESLTTLRRERVKPKTWYHSRIVYIFASITFALLLFSMIFSSIVKSRSADRIVWANNVAIIKPEFPYNEVRYVSGNKKIVNREFLLDILESLQLQQKPELEKLRDLLVERIKSGSILTEQDHPELAGYPHLTFNYSAIEADWSSLRREITSYAQINWMIRSDEAISTPTTTPTETNANRRQYCDELRLEAKKTGALNGDCVLLNKFLATYASSRDCEVISTMENYSLANCATN